jgi:galactokinase
VKQPQTPNESAPPGPTTGSPLLSLEPVPELLKRVRAELATDFPPGTQMRISRAPGRLDVMGGIADYTGSLVCEATLDRAAAVALTPRSDRIVQVFSFNLFDEGKPNRVQISLDTLAKPIESVHLEFISPETRWAGYLAGSLTLLQDRKLIDLKNPAIRGMNLALVSKVPLGGGVSSSAAIEVAAMMNIMDHLKIRRDDPLLLASMCQEVENRVVGAPCGIMDQVSSCSGHQESLLRMICQPHDLLPALRLPPGIRVVGINSKVKHSVGGGMYGITRCAAFMAHRIILEKMCEMGEAAGKKLDGDPMNGYLANLDPEDYKRFFRPYLPEQIQGKIFLEQYGGTIDTATTVNPNQSYHVRQAADHHVLEARRVKNFVGHLETASGLPIGSSERGLALDKAGHLMYASHLSYTNDALLGAPECDLIVDLVRKRERAGLYGAKITGGGSGGTVAVLADVGSKTDQALVEIMAAYEEETGKKPEAFLGTSPGAWVVGTTEVHV